MADAVIVDDVSKRFRIYHERNQSLKVALMRGGRARFEEFWALRDVDLRVAQGKTFGLVGHNGSGKSTLLKTLARILVPDKGRVTTVGRVSALLELGAGFHPELSGRDNVYLNGSILGLSKRDIDQKFDEIVGFAGLEQFIDTPVKNYSSGMYVRLGFSIAINVEPDILMVDEVLAVGDEEFQRRSMDKFLQFRRDGRTVVIVSHALGTVREMCDEVAWLDHGQILGVGDPDEIVGRYAETSLKVMHSEQEAVVAPAKVTVIEALAGSEPTGSVRSGGPVTFRLRWQSSETVPGAQFAISVRALDGQVVATSLFPGLTDLAAGEGVAQVRVEHLPLTAGTYTVGGSVVPGAGDRAVAEDQSAVELVVHPRGETDGPGVVALHGEWEAAS